VVVVTGDVGAVEAEAVVREALAPWLDAAGVVAPAEPRPRPLSDEGIGILLVHRPAGDLAAVRVGHLLPPAGSHDWPALSALGRILGGGEGSRLPEAFRIPARGHASLWRGREMGHLEVAIEAPLSLTPQALATTLREMSRLSSEMVLPRELREAEIGLREAFSLEAGSEDRGASYLASEASLGLAPSSQEALEERVRELRPPAVQEVARRWFSARSARVVVVGDARALHEELRRVAPLRIVDERGEPLEIGELAADGERPRLDAGTLSPLDLSYRLRIGEERVGSMSRRLTSELGGTMRFSGSAELAADTVRQWVTFSVPDFRPLGASWTSAQGGRVLESELRVTGDRVVGRVSNGASVRTIERRFEEDWIVGDMLELALWLAPLESGRVLRLTGLRMSDGNGEEHLIRVGAIEEVQVPAGIFRAYRVEVEGAQAQTVWARVEPPHVLVRIALADQPLVFELEAISPGAGRVPRSALPPWAR
jgi:hypothetical protein